MANLSQEIILIVAFSCFFILVAIGIIMLILIYQKRQLGFLRDKEQLTAQFEQILLQSQLEIQEQTFRHISQELHDNLGHQASLIKINLNTLSLDDLPKAADKLDASRQLMRQLIADLKSLSVGINGDFVAKAGLLKALETEVDRLNKTDQFSVILYEQGDCATLDTGKTIILYRMAQEILNNIIKHSEAGKISITLTSNENFVTLAFCDDGIGFDVAGKLANEQGAGLGNLHQRAKLLNADLNICSDINTGTTITIRTPK